MAFVTNSLSCPAGSSPFPGCRMRAPTSLFTTVASVPTATIYDIAWQSAHLRNCPRHQVHYDLGEIDMRIPIIVLSAAFVILPGDLCLAAPFCDDVKAVLAASSNISDLTGSQKSSTSWLAKRTVSGFAPCEVSRLPKGDIIFSCEARKSRSFDDAKRDYDRLQKDVEVCLPSPTWNHMVTAKGQDFNLHGFNSVSDGLSGNLAIFRGFEFDPQRSGAVDIWYPVLTIYQREK
jgi:hypothetical protein